MAFFGITSFGTAVYLNRCVRNAGKILVIGSVEPHYFAGYTGGRKAFLPGVAAYTTIEQNHKLALDSRAKTLALEDNPVHLDMLEAMDFIDAPIFSIMTVLDRSHGIHAVVAGSIHAAFQKSLTKANDIFVVRASGMADIVISLARKPMDVDMYQSQKAIDNGKLVLKPGGVLILVSACRLGLGEDSFFRLLAASQTPEEVLDHIEHAYVLGWHKAAKMAEVLIKSHVFAVTELPKAVVSEMFMEPFATVQEAFNAALRLVGPSPQVIVLFDGCLTVPQIT